MMMYRMAGLLALLLSACVAVPPAPPEEFAENLRELLDAEQTSQAQSAFAQVEQLAEYRDQVYPKLYSAAEASYSTGEYDRAARYLRFLEEEYPDAVAARQALLYCLFMERSQQAKAPVEAQEETQRLIEELGRDEVADPQWFGLIAAQNAIDRGDLGQARASFAGFLEEWDGQPENLWLYVEDVQRYLTSHDSAQ